MRKTFFVVAVSLLAAACSDQGPAPTDLARPAPTIQLSSIGGPTSEDPCSGYSPCDSYTGYWHSGFSGTPPAGFCFIPPMVNNHSSSPECSAPNVPGLDGLFELVWCEVHYPVVGGVIDSTNPPTIPEEENCGSAGPLTDNGGFYQASVRFNGSNRDKTFRLYVVGGGVDYAFRDVIVNPNYTSPADAFLHSIGTGTEPVKVKIMQWEECAYYDSQENGTDNAATCLITGLGGESFTFDENGVKVTVTYQPGNQPHFANFVASECLSLGFSENESGEISGNALVDVPLADCKISVNSEQLSVLDPPAHVDMEVQSTDWTDPNGKYYRARLNLIRANGDGQRTVGQDSDPGWWPLPGEVTFRNPIRRWLDRGLDRLVSVFGPEPVLAWPSNVYNLRGYTDLQFGVMGYLKHNMTSDGPCATPHPSCIHVPGTAAGQRMPITIKVEAPTDPARAGGLATIPVPGARIHVVPQAGSGSVYCPAVNPPGQQCYEVGQDDMSTFPPLASSWDHLVVLSGTDGTILLDWELAAGNNKAFLWSCGNARPGPNEADSQVGGIWGPLRDCSDRDAARTDAMALDNGPKDGLSPFEPVDQFEVAMYGLPLSIETTACGVPTINGTKGTGEWDCAQKTGFIVNLPGPKPSSPNAWLYAHSDGSALYLALEVAGTDLGNKVFFNIFESSLTRAAGDELLLMDFSKANPAEDWHFTQQCVGNNANSLCGEKDLRTDDGAGAGIFDAKASGQGANGHAFYEFIRPYPTPGSTAGGGYGKEDLSALVSGQTIGIRVQRTQGQGGGQGGFEYPAGTGTYVPYTIP